MKNIKRGILGIIALACMANSVWATSDGKTTTLEDVSVSVSVESGSGFMKSRPDGSIESYPDGTTATLTVKGNLNGVESEVQIQGKYIAMISDVALFRSPENVCFILFKGRAFPSYPVLDSKTGQRFEHSSSSALATEWLVSQYDNLGGQLEDIGNAALNGDASNINLLGLFVHPASHLKLVDLMKSNNAEISTKAQNAYNTWTEINSAFVDGAQ